MINSDEPTVCKCVCSWKVELILSAILQCPGVRTHLHTTFVWFKHFVGFTGSGKHSVNITPAVTSTALVNMQLLVHSQCVSGETLALCQYLFRWITPCAYVERKSCVRITNISELWYLVLISSLAYAISVFRYSVRCIKSSIWLSHGQGCESFGAFVLQVAIFVTRVTCHHVPLFTWSTQYRSGGKSITRPLFVIVLTFQLMRCLYPWWTIYWGNLSMTKFVWYLE